MNDELDRKIRILESTDIKEIKEDEEGHDLIMDESNYVLAGDEEVTI